MKTKRVTTAEMRRALRRYGQRILEGEARERPNTSPEVGRYCEALKVVWELAKRVAKERR